MIVSKYCVYCIYIRKGSRLGHDTIIDGMLKDGLWDVYNDFAMGNCAEICADQHVITRDEQVMFMGQQCKHFLECFIFCYSLP